MSRRQILAAAGVILAVVPLIGSETMPGAQTEPATPPPLVLEFAGSWGERGSDPGQLAQPLALATDADGLVYIADAANRSIEKFGSRGEPRLSFTDARLRLPTGLAVDRGGAIYAADRRANFVFVYSPEGKPLLYLGGRPGRLFRQPVAVAVDDDGDIFVLEAGASRIQKFNPRGRLLKVWGREGAGRGELRQPQALALGPDGLLYVADTGNDRIAKFTRDGAFVASWPVGSPVMPASGVASLAVSDSDAFTLNPATAQLSVWTLEGRRVLDYDLKKHLSSMPVLPPTSIPLVDILGPERLALAGRDLILVLSSTSPSVLLFRLHP